MEPARLLIVEDEKLIALDLKNRLTSFGWDIVGLAGSVTEALELARREHPDLVLMDIVLADRGSGVDAAAELHQELFTPVVFITAYSDDDTIERAEQAEPYGFLIKPFNDRALYSTIKLALSRSRAETELARQEHILSAILRSVGEGILATTASGTVLYSNPTAQNLIGMSKSDLEGAPLQTVFRLHDPIDNQMVSLPPESMEPGEPLQFDDVELIGQQGARIRIDGTITKIKDNGNNELGYALAFRDVTDVHALSDRLSYQRTHDSLTGLLNRDEFVERVSETLACHTRKAVRHAYIYADVDNFKLINDVFGHHAGDELLRIVATDIDNAVEKHHLVARVGDDEFGVFLPETDSNVAREWGDRLYSLIARRFTWNSRSFQVTASVAVVPVPPDTRDPDRILAAADDACNVLKDEGGNGVKTYDTAGYTFLKQRGEMQWTQRIGEALDQDRFVLYRQEIHHLRLANERKHELLVRMLDSDGSVILPGRFIPAAEKYNLMPAIDRWVVRRALAYLADSRPPTIHCINLSGASVADPSLFEFLSEQIRWFGIEAEMLCFEITETAAIQNLRRAVDLIRELRNIGVQFALDDFGNGFSSFAYLKNLPVEYLKLDGSFVQNVVENNVDREMVRAMNGIGHVLGMKTVAEYVKDETIAETLREIGVDYGQGFDLSRPVPLTDLPEAR